MSKPYWKPYCPFCDGGRLATEETLIGFAGVLAVTADGDVEWDGYTRVVWDSSDTTLDKQGRPVLFCQDCDEIVPWESIVFGESVAPGEEMQ